MMPTSQKEICFIQHPKAGVWGMTLNKCTHIQWLIIIS